MAHTRSTPVTERAVQPPPHIHTRYRLSLGDVWCRDAILFLIQKPPVVLLMHVENFRFQKKTADSTSPLGNSLYFNYLAARCVRANREYIDTGSTG